MDIHEMIAYGLVGLISLVAYLAKGKLEGIDDTIRSLNKKLDDHTAEDNAVHMKMLEYYVTKAEYSQTVGRIFDMLTDIAEDIKGLLTSKVDK